MIFFGMNRESSRIRFNSIHTEARDHNYDISRAHVYATYYAWYAYNFHSGYVEVPTIFESMRLATGSEENFLEVCK